MSELPHPALGPGLAASLAWGCPTGRSRHVPGRPAAEGWLLRPRVCASRLNQMAKSCLWNLCQIKRLVRPVVGTITHLDISF